MFSLYDESHDKLFLMSKQCKLHYGTLLNYEPANPDNS